MSTVHSSLIVIEGTLVIITALLGLILGTLLRIAAQPGQADAKAQADRKAEILRKFAMPRPSGDRQ